MKKTFVTFHRILKSLNITITQNQTNILIILLAPAGSSQQNVLNYHQRNSYFRISLAKSKAFRQNMCPSKLNNHIYSFSLWTKLVYCGKPLHDSPWLHRDAGKSQDLMLTQEVVYFMVKTIFMVKTKCYSMSPQIGYRFMLKTISFIFTKWYSMNPQIDYRFMLLWNIINHDFCVCGWSQYQVRINRITVS